MAKKKKHVIVADPPYGAAAQEPAAQGAEAPEEIPISQAPLPFELLDGRALGELFELCFGDRKLLDLCRELKLYSPGYRIENLPPNQVARMLADEVQAAKDARALLDKEVRAAIRNPVFEGRPVDEGTFLELLELFTGDGLQHLARCAWKALLDNEPKRALAAIDLGLEALDAPAQAVKPERKPQLPSDVAELRAALDEARKQAERSQAESESAHKQLAEARAEIARREKIVAELRDELHGARAEMARSNAELQRLHAAGEGKSLAEARRLSDENRSLSEKLRTALEERDRLRETQTIKPQPVAFPAQPVEEEPLPSAEEASTFLIPIFTREFYDSIQDWDRRMQRAAFDKVSLLARDWRHGSLRALALEGLPGYYRIRIATDVRLIYRRGEGNQLEILSLIDREDLDRYIRQARTR